MAQFYSAQATPQVASASAGLGGSPNQNRSNVDRGPVQAKKFSYTVPASSGPASGDDLIVAMLKVTDVIYFISVNFGALGAGVTGSFGKIDPNASGNNDPVHYSQAIDMSLAGDFNGPSLNASEQVGTDPAGDQTIGQTAPGFGQNLIQVAIRFGGGTPAAAAVITGVIFYSAGEV